MPRSLHIPLKSLAAHFFVTNKRRQEIFDSEEGCTQGNPSVMSFYAVGLKPLIDILAEICIEELCRQAWFADDSSAIGKLIQVKKWWLKRNEVGTSPNLARQS